MSLVALHWLIAIGLIGTILLVTVSRHAWLAGYNLEGPVKLVTRYVIYIAVPIWLSALVILNEKFTFNQENADMVFPNRNWIDIPRLPGSLQEKLDPADEDRLLDLH